MKVKDKKHSGFTLIELSVVMVIIALVVAGVLIGRDLIQAAKLRAVASEVQKFQTAVNVFKLKYGGIPGDIPNAASFFPGGRNGNNNGKVDWLLETYAAWHQLSRANLIAGNYTGNEAVPGPAVQIGINAPGSGFNDAIGYLYTYYYQSVFNLSGNHLMLGSQAAQVLDGAALTVQDAWSLDHKMDDGVCASGLLRSWGGFGVIGDCCSLGAPFLYRTDNLDMVACVVHFY